MSRCPWCEANDALRRYHDTEWGVPLHDDQKQFEFLMLEVMQCGLNWNMMLQKREVFRACFDDFDFDKVAAYGEADIGRILSTPGMIRSRRKVEAVIHNARCFPCSVFHMTCARKPPMVSAACSCICLGVKGEPGVIMAQHG